MVQMAAVLVRVLDLVKFHIVNTAISGPILYELQATFYIKKLYLILWYVGIYVKNFMENHASGAGSQKKVPSLTPSVQCPRQGQNNLRDLNSVT